MEKDYLLLEKILKENNMNVEEALYSALFVVDIESKSDMDFLKEYYHLDGEGYYIKRLYNKYGAWIKIHAPY